MVMWCGADKILVRREKQEDWWRRLERMSGTIACKKICHNSIDITHADAEMVEKIWDILKGGYEDEHGCVDILFGLSSFTDDEREMPVVISEQRCCTFDKKDWFFIMEMQNIALFSPSISPSFLTVFQTCMSSYKTGDKVSFDEQRRELMTISYRDCWGNCHAD